MDSVIFKTLDLSAFTTILQQRSRQNCSLLYPKLLCPINSRSQKYLLREQMNMVQTIQKTRYTKAMVYTKTKLQSSKWPILKKNQYISIDAKLKITSKKSLSERMFSNSEKYPFVFGFKLVWKKNHNNGFTYKWHSGNNILWSIEHNRFQKLCKMCIELNTCQRWHLKLVMLDYLIKTVGKLICPS
jgi:hypothetical protein